MRVGPVGMQVAANIRSLREARHLTQGELAALASETGTAIHRCAVSQIETGHRRIAVDELAALAYALEVRPAVLLDPLRIAVTVEPDD